LKLPTYPHTAPSCIEWLGNIPEHWHLKRLKYIGSANDDVLKEDTPPDWELLYVDIGSVDTVAGITAKVPMAFEDAPSRARRLVSDGDTIVSTVRTYLKAIAPINQPEPNLVVSTGFAVIRPQTVESGFLAWCLRSSYFVETVVSRSTGVSYPATNSSEVLTITVPFPEKAEQQAISQFLVRETGLIDRLVATKRELIERMKEKRTALISRTVTRGLPAAAARAIGVPENPPLKPSGLDWLGDIPMHWQVLPLKRVAQIAYGVGGEIDRSLTEGLKTISLPNISIEGNLTLDDVPFAEVSDAEKQSVLLRKGDLLFNWRNGSSDHLGKTAYFDAEGEYSHVSFLLRIRFEHENHCSAFFRYLLTGYRVTGFFKHSKAGVNNTFNRTELSALPVMLPPLPEQVAIAAYLDLATAKLDALTGKVEEAIERLQEYRTSLIAAAVTGKIDVRGTAA
jgi:type I restriction enzyme S subunit